MKPREVSPFQFLMRAGGAVTLILLGGLIFAQTNLGIYQTADPDFLKWLKVAGVALIFHGILLFASHVMGFAERTEGIAVSIIFSAIYFILLYQLFSNPDIVPVLAYDEDQAYLLEDSDFKGLLVKSVIGGILLFIVVNVVGHLKSLLYLSKKRGRK